MKSRLKVNTLTALFFAALWLSQTAFAAPGDLDATFGGTGKLRVGVGGGNDNGKSLARQSDGKLIVAGQSGDISGNGFSLVRYNTNGTLDPTFGTGGKVLTVIGEQSDALAVTVLADGKILAAGYALTNSANDFAVAKYNSDGTLDAAFGSGGIVTTDFNNSNDAGYAMAVQTDGKIAVVGQSGANSSALVRYNANGSLDTAFGANGKVMTVISIFSTFADAVVILNGKIYAAGTANNLSGNSPGGFVSCYNQNGSLNTVFGNGGTARLDSGGANNAAVSLIVLAATAGEEKIIVAGSVITNFALTTTYQSLWSFDANNGSVDSTFGSGGRTSLNVAGTTGNAVRILSSLGTPSRIIVAGSMTAFGTANSDFLIARYLISGALDTAFDGDGIATADINSDDDGRAMLIQPNDNKIVVAGTSSKSTMFGANGISSDTDFAALRFNPNGALDTTFSGDGKRLDDLGNRSVAAKSTTVQTDGKIVAAGDNVIARFNTDGSFDTTFDEDGKAKIPFGFITSAAIQTDGKIVLAAEIGSSNYFLAYRLNADGSPDATFDADGLATATVGTSDTSIRALAIQADGAIVLAGRTTVGTGAGANIDFAVVRLLPNGALDTTFDADGVTTTPIGVGADQANAVAVQSDGKIVAAGYALVNSNDDFAVVRYTANGALDASFSGDGKQTTAFGAGDDIANAVKLQTDGKIVVAGSATVAANNSDFAAARYNGDGSPDAAFSGDGKLTVAIGTLSEAGSAVAVQTDGKIVIAGTTETVAGVTDFAVVRCNSDGSLDSSSFVSNSSYSAAPNSPLYGSGGKVVIDVSGGNDFANAIALDSSGRAVVIGQANGLFGLIRLQGNAAPTAADVSVSGRVFTPYGRGLRNAAVSMTDVFGNTRTTRTGTFGYFHFVNVAAGGTYIFTVASKQYEFSPLVVSVLEDMDGLNFTAFLSENSDRRK